VNRDHRKFVEYEGEEEIREKKQRAAIRKRMEMYAYSPTFQGVESLKEHTDLSRIMNSV
jgi:hypothetical protein